MLTVVSVGCAAWMSRSLSRRTKPSTIREARTRGVRFPTWLRQWRRGIALGLFAATVGLLCGGIEGTHQITNLKPYEGTPLEITAQISSVKAIRGGEAAVIVIEQISPIANTVGTRSRRAYAKATWIVFGSAADTWMQVGNRLVARGYLTAPPRFDTHGKPLASVLAAYGIDYEWIGRMTAVMAPQHVTSAAVRQGLQGTVATADPSHRSDLPLLASILFGGSASSPALTQQFLAAGLLHVLAASGANVLLLLAAVNGTLGSLARWVRLPSWIWTLFLLTFLAVFCVLCNDSASIVRASLMAAYRILGKQCGRAPGAWEAMLVAVWLMVWIQAPMVTGVSSLLSFCATIAVMLAGRHRPSLPYRHRLRWLGWCYRHLRQGLQITVAVELILAPLTLHFFGQVTPYSLISNLLIEPLLALLLPVTAAYLISGPLTAWSVALHWLCQGLGAVAAMLLSGLLRWVAWVSTWRGAIAIAPTWSTLQVSCYYVAIWAVWWLARSSGRVHAWLRRRRLSALATRSVADRLP